MDIYNNGNWIGRFKAGQTVEIEIKKSYALIDFQESRIARSNAILIAEDGDYVIEVGTWIRGWKLFCLLLYIPFVSNAYSARLKERHIIDTNPYP